MTEENVLYKTSCRCNVPNSYEILFHIHSNDEKKDFERTNIFLRMMKERINTLIKEHKEAWDSYKNSEKD